jgi:hypothetical protein
VPNHGRPARRIARKSCAGPRTTSNSCAVGTGTPLAWHARMANPPSNESWTIPLFVLMYTTMAVGFIMVLVIILMH